MTPHPGAAFSSGQPFSGIELLRHLERRCPDCRSAITGTPTGIGNLHPILSRVGKRAQDLVDARGRNARPALELLQYVLTKPDFAWPELVDSKPQLHVMPVAHALRVEAAERHAEDPRRALALAELSVHVAKLATREKVTGILDADELAWCLAQLARTQARLGEFELAESTLAQANRVGAVDPQFRAFRHEVRGVIHALRLEPELALEALGRASAIQKKLGDWHGMGRLEMIATAALGDAGRPNEACVRAIRAIAFLDGDRDPRLKLGALHNLVFHEAGAGRPQSALEYLDTAKPFFAKHGQTTDLIRLSWAEARIRLRLGHYAEAEVLYLETCERFAELGLLMEVASAALEACEALASVHRWKSVESVARLVLELERGMKREIGATAAWLVLREATKNQAAVAITIEKALAALHSPRQRS